MNGSCCETDASSDDVPRNHQIRGRRRVWDALKLTIRAQGTQDRDSHAPGDVPLKRYWRAGTRLVQNVLSMWTLSSILCSVSPTILHSFKASICHLPNSSIVKEWCWTLRAWLMEPSHTTSVLLSRTCGDPMRGGCTIAGFEKCRNRSMATSCRRWRRNYL